MSSRWDFYIFTRVVTMLHNVWLDQTSHNLYILKEQESWISYVNRSIDLHIRLGLSLANANTSSKYSVINNLLGASLRT